VRHGENEERLQALYTGVIKSNCKNVHKLTDIECTVCGKPGGYYPLDFIHDQANGYD
jgi:hypothetical protein